MYLEGINVRLGLMSDTLVLLMRVTQCIFGFELSILEERSLKYRWMVENYSKGAFTNDVIFWGGGSAKVDKG